MTAATRVLRSGLPEAAVATGSVAMPSNEPGSDASVGMAAQPSPKVSAPASPQARRAPRRHRVLRGGLRRGLARRCRSRVGGLLVAAAQAAMPRESVSAMVASPVLRAMRFMGTAFREGLRSRWPRECFRRVFGASGEADWCRVEKTSADVDGDLLDAAGALGEGGHPGSRLHVAVLVGGAAGQEVLALARRPTRGTTGASSRCWRPGRAWPAATAPPSMRTSTLSMPTPWAQATPPMKVRPDVVVRERLGGVDAAGDLDRRVRGPVALGPVGLLVVVGRERHPGQPLGRADEAVEARAPPSAPGSRARAAAGRRSCRRRSSRRGRRWRRSAGVEIVIPSTSVERIWSALVLSMPARARTSVRRTPSQRAAADVGAADVVGDAGQGDVALDHLELVEVGQRRA